MKAALKLYRHASAVFQTIYTLIRGMDSRILSQHILKIGQAREIDMIAYRTYQCFKELFDCNLFALALYNQENSQDVDIWMEPKTDNAAVIHHIKKDFPNHGTYYNIRSFENPLDSELPGNSGFETSRIIAIPVMNGASKAVVYIIPGHRILADHQNLFSMIGKIVKASISSYLRMKNLESAAFIDPLTGCYNRRAFDQSLDHDIAKADRYGSDMSVIMFDIDHFKKINDTFGHKAGDEVLRAFSKNITAAIRKSDYLARYGGEEFVLVLPETKFPIALELAERLRKTTEKMDILHNGKRIKVTTSAGVTSYKRGMDKNSLILKADNLLYDAKKQGRNRVNPGLRLCRNSTGTESGY